MDALIHLPDLVGVAVCASVFEVVVDFQRKFSCAEESDYYVFGVTVAVNVECVFFHDFPPIGRFYRNSAGSRSLK